MAGTSPSRACTRRSTFTATGPLCSRRYGFARRTLLLIDDAALRLVHVLVKLQQQDSSAAQRTSAQPNQPGTATTSPAAVQ